MLYHINIISFEIDISTTKFILNRTIMKNSNLPLIGIKVVELTHMVMGPTVGLVLADLGAEVIKIEPPKGDNTRHLTGSGSGYFPMYNRNKKSMCLDLKSEKGKEIALKLINQSDIFIENFRPGAMQKLGFAFDELKKNNPKLIYCSLKGFLSGPYQHRTGLDEVVQMMGGLAYMTGLPDKPMRAGSSVIDISGGMFGVIGILAALEKRHRTGEGELITSSLFETSAFMVGQHMAQEVVTGEAPPPMSVRKSAWSIYDIFYSQENERVFVGVVSNTLWKKFCQEFELTDFAKNESLNTNNERVKQRELILPVIEAMFASMTKAEIMQRLDRAGIPFAPVNTPSDLFADPHLNSSNALLDVKLTDGENKGKAAALPALPIEMADTRFALRNNLPKAGEHSISVMQDLGYSDSEIKDMLSDGVIKEH